MLSVQKCWTYSGKVSDRGPETGRIPIGKPQRPIMTDVAVDKTYRPFIEKGYIYLYGPKKKKIAITILRDTGASQSILLKEKMPRGAQKIMQEKITVKGIGRKIIEIPLCKVDLESKWKTDLITVGIMGNLPMKSIRCGSQSNIFHKKDRIKYHEWKRLDDDYSREGPLFTKQIQRRWNGRGRQWNFTNRKIKRRTNPRVEKWLLLENYISGEGKWR